MIGDDGSIFQQSAADVLIDPARIRHFQYGIGGGVAYSCAMRTAISGMALALGTLWLVSSAAQSAPSTASPAPVADAQAFLARVAGVYKGRFENGNVSGEKYESENILEVVPVDDHSAYFRMHLEFFNGHIGGISGIATYKAPNTLVYDNARSDSVRGGGERCILEITWSAQTVSTVADYEKTPGCREYHGARGSLNGDFQASSRRRIRYMQRLKESRQFRAAMDEYHRAD